MDTYLAIDIGASSGRHIVGSTENGKISLDETYRFENGISKKNGHKCWDIDHIRESVIEGIAETVKKGYSPKSVGVDTWAVDFVLLDENDEIIGDAVSYRDSRAERIQEELEEKNILKFGELYEHTGIAYQQFNTIYQLLALKKEHPDYLERAKTFLMIPDYLNFVLTGVKANEYTNASTTALVNAKTKTWDRELIRSIGLPVGIFKEVQMPGASLGMLRQDIADRVGAQMEVVLPATHDTGSAFLAVPARDDNSVFLSSGTWSLIGCETKEAIITPESCGYNYTNEGGYNYRNRFIRNIMGLWMMQNVRNELGKMNGTCPSFPDLIKAAEEFSEYDVKVNVTDDRFLSPDSMTGEIKSAALEKGEKIPDAVGAIVQVIYNSLVDSYMRNVNILSLLTGKDFTSINIVGGGSQDMYLNRMTAKATGLTVYAGPTEGTALGNLIVQFIKDNKFMNLAEARQAVGKSFDIRTID